MERLPALDHPFPGTIFVSPLFFKKNLFRNSQVTYICVTYKLLIMEKKIKQKWFFNQPPAEVWEYLTKPELIEQWLMKTSFKPIKGYKFQFTFTAKPDSKYRGVVECEVLEITPCSKLSYSWNGSTQDGSRHYNSVVAWTLLSKDNGTELQLEHDGFTILEDILAHSSGWNSCLTKMENLINEKSKNENTNA